MASSFQKGLDAVVAGLLNTGGLRPCSSWTLSPWMCGVLTECQAVEGPWGRSLGLWAVFRGRGRGSQSRASRRQMSTCPTGASNTARWCLVAGGKLPALPSPRARAKGSLPPPHSGWGWCCHSSLAWGPRARHLQIIGRNACQRRLPDSQQRGCPPLRGGAARGRPCAEGASSRTLKHGVRPRCPGPRGAVPAGSGSSRCPRRSLIPCLMSASFRAATGPWRMALAAEEALWLPPE